ncbi:MAG: hypothetical protein K2X56_18410 [Mycobacterium pseudokansasii]|uniref:hypothetical protein n=1 Tax=Mycobacterium pseudokansasii TaxID=2341080 RepID=UPI0007B53471|nr:hypothetical protein [Mycobacterium pseudokansasii]KZS66226.1 hypothetical protein A4G27_11945 [Mycobacterium kansasii]MBY0390003.1 hypothetical protein [Mycobacterium pseudokansasii]VBA33306.1 hypothetical protein LAUMK35_05437 [Mycobacterium pseudokansasii]VBA34929.1 hypothetical protein LAUMK21_05397 [Mycobacterium pseudokansasii]
MIDRFAEFVTVVDDISGDSVEVEGCQCYYSNSLEGIGGRNWMIGYVTGWSPSIGPDEQLDDAEHVGFRVYRVDEDDGVKRGVWVHMDEGKIQRSELDITVVAVPAEDSQIVSGDPRVVARRLMDAAHRLENQTFEACFSDAMKKEWEVQS